MPDVSRSGAVTGGHPGGHDARVVEQLERQWASDAELRLDVASGAESLATWFLGPKAENGDLLRQLLDRAVQGQIADRRAYQPKDPAWVTEDIKQSPAYKDGVAALEAALAGLVRRLQGSVPFYSYRYQAHMLWDTTLPAVVGYLAAMLANQNNVAAEASPVTTALEMAVGRDLCTMLGYTVPPPGANGDTSGPPPWGHITCDGSVANIESMWAARNLKYFPVSLAAAVEHEPRLAPAEALTVRLPDGSSARLVDLDAWARLNLGADEILALPTRLQAEFGISTDDLDAILQSYSVQSLGLVQLTSDYLPGVPAGVVGGPGTIHYWGPTAAAILGIGSNQLIHVPVDLDARMDVDLLRAELDRCLDAERPVIQVVAVVGSTEESAVDPLHDIVALREEYRRFRMDFPIHVDAAWGGYFASILRPAPSDTPPDGAERDVRRYTPAMTMSAYVEKQYRAFPSADSITVDPHKGGYVPYPAGGLCYRNASMRDLVSLKAPIVYHGDVDPTVGVYGVEGSKPGAAPAAIYLSHRVIRPDQSGYGKILGRTLFNSKRLYAALVTLPQDDDPFVIETIQRLPAVKRGESGPAVRRELARIAREIVPRTNEKILADANTMALFRELGSDQNIVSYAFNFLVDGKRNENVAKLNALNTAVFEQLSLGRDLDRIPETKMFVTSSSADPAVYGESIVEDFRRRLGVTGSADTPITFLISTTMDPWLTDTATGNFIPTLMEIMRETVLAAVAQISRAAVAPVAR
jgi:glutamate/tyrosine decarboxylase-like PLP-dependent enzyme